MTPITLRPDASPETTTHPGQTSFNGPLRIRLILFAFLLTLECFILALLRHPWLSLQQPAATPIVLLACLAFFGRRQFRAAHLAAEPVSRRFAALHALTFALLAVTNLALLHSAGIASGPEQAGILLWYVALLLLGPSLVFTFFAPGRVVYALRTLGAAWPYALLSALLIMSGRALARLVWDAPDSRFGRSLASITFRAVHSLLTLIYPDVFADPTHNILGTRGFLVEIAGVCSGMEGLALIFVLTVGWLLYARDELRLARAVWLVPLALALMGVLNVIRIAALIAIGASGHPTVAINGFHAEAGWILFNLVAFGFLLTVQRLSWVRKATAIPTEAQASSQPHTNLAAVHLLPFLAIIATSLFTQAASSGFEWLYPLRFVVAAVILWSFRAAYRRMDWRFGWLGPAAGALVFVLWLALSPSPSGTNTTLATGLAALPNWQRIAWLTIRVLAATLTVPLAEELAFRGYLARRILQPNFETVPYRTLTPLAILISSVVFALMHGRMAVTGFIAGLIFALVAKARNRIGEAVAAHVTANLLLALWVLLRGDYSLW